jgi:apolipoprotein N-acyltransferase
MSVLGGTALEVSAGASLLQRYFLACLSGVMLAAPLLNSTWFIVGWIAFVPLLLAIYGQRLWVVYGVSSICGLVFYAIITYWITDYIHLFKGYRWSLSFILGGVFWLYCSQLIALITVSFVWLKRYAGVHELVLFPLLVSVAFDFFPMLFSVQLGEGQRDFLVAIQALDLVGVNGLDVILALVNILLFRLTFCRQSLISWGSLSAVGLLVVWFGYGVYMLSHWQERTADWPTAAMGLVQPNEKPDLERLPVYRGYSRIYPPEIEISEKLAAAGAQWVVWPEARYKGYFDEPEVRRGFDRAVRDMGVNLIFQDMEQERDHENYSGSTLQVNNKAAFIDRAGNLRGQHQKMKLVAFGEYMPLVNSAPWLAYPFEQFFGRFTRNITAGLVHQSFDGDGFSVVPLICNEIMFPRFVAAAVGDKPRHMLVGMSSNGWFGKTLQPYQHTNTSSLRAVENRLPLVHVVNNGPSIVASPTGKILFRSAYHQAGGYRVDVPYPADGGGSFYSRHPYVFMVCLYVLLGLAGVAAVIRFGWGLWLPVEASR